MLPTPTTRRPSIRNCLIAVRCARVSACRLPASKARDSGSMPRWRISGCASGGSRGPEHRAEAARIAQAQQLVRRRRGRNGRACRAASRRRPARRLPDMPRCRIRWPSPQSSSRYLPRRLTARTTRPASERTAVGDRPAQPRLAHRHRGDRAPDEMGRDAPAGDFDFGEFRHRQLTAGCLVRGTKYTYTARRHVRTLTPARRVRRDARSPQPSSCGGVQAQQQSDEPDDDDDDRRRPRRRRRRRSRRRTCRCRI